MLIYENIFQEAEMKFWFIVSLLMRSFKFDSLLLYEM